MSDPYSEIQLTFGTGGFTSNVERNYEDPSDYSVNISFFPSIESLMKKSGRSRWSVICLTKDMRRSRKGNARKRLAIQLQYPTLDDVYLYIKKQMRK